MVEVRPGVPIVSFTFDDFPQSAIREAGEILQRYEVHATYYVSLGLMDCEIPAGKAFSHGDLKRVIDEGHELGCHTFAHCHAWETKPETFEESVVKNRQTLKNMFPDTTFETLSYPIAWPRPQTKRRMAGYFPCCRGTGSSFNIGRADAGNLQAVFLEKNLGDPGALKGLIAENARQQGWLILATHDVCANPSPFGCTPEFFNDIVECVIHSGAKVLPIAKAWTMSVSNRGCRST